MPLLKSSPTTAGYELPEARERIRAGQECVITISEGWYRAYPASYPHPAGSASGTATSVAEPGETVRIMSKGKQIGPLEYTGVEYWVIERSPDERMRVPNAVIYSDGVLLDMQRKFAELQMNWFKLQALLDVICRHYEIGPEMVEEAEVLFQFSWEEFLKSKD